MPKASSDQPVKLTFKSLYNIHGNSKEAKAVKKELTLQGVNANTFKDSHMLQRN